MRTGVILAVGIGVFSLSVDVALAAKPTKTSPFSEADLQIQCEVFGGTFISADGVYACFLDGTYIICKKGPPTSCYEGRGKPQQTLLGTIVATQATLLAQQQQIIAAVQGIRVDIGDMKDAMDGLHSACAPPDLVPLALEGSAPPDYCRYDVDHDNLIVRVKNQGSSDAGASTLRLTFTTPSGPEPVELPIPPLKWGVPAVDLAVSVPVACFDRLADPQHPGACSFQIAVDVAGVVVESDETNNNALGTCGPLTF